MRLSFVFVHSLRALLILSLARLSGCSQSQPALPAPAPAATGSSNCALQLSGNLSDSLALPSCGELNLSPSTAGDFELDFHFPSQGLQSLDISIALGPSPSPGSYSSETSSEWSAIGLTSSQCPYSAGSDSVPRGSFKLTLSAIEIADGGTEVGADAGADVGAGADADVVADAGADADTDAEAGTDRAAGAAHGTLELTMYVQAPPATDCGAGDVENIRVDF